MKLAIATPFYSMTGYSPYITALTQTAQILCKTGVDWEYWDYSGDTYIDRARNMLVYRFFTSDCTDLLFIDSDLSWDPMGLVHLLKSPYELTGGVYPIKNNWEHFTESIIYDGNHAPVQDLSTGLIESVWLPAGFMRIRRSCIDRMYEAYKDNWFYSSAGEHIPNLFECSVNHEHYRVGEDVEFCKKWTDIGGKCWIEPRITFNHAGVKLYEGNLHEHLLRLIGEQRVINAVKQG